MCERAKLGKSARQQSYASVVEEDRAVSHEEEAGGQTAVISSAINDKQEVGSVLHQEQAVHHDHWFQEAIAQDGDVSVSQFLSPST